MITGFSTVGLEAWAYGDGELALEGFRTLFTRRYGYGNASDEYIAEVRLGIDLQ